MFVTKSLDPVATLDSWKRISAVKGHLDPYMHYVLASWEKNLKSTLNKVDLSKCYD